jgi:hypothetical protein
MANISHSIDFYPKSKFKQQITFFIGREKILTAPLEIFISWVKKYHQQWTDSLGYHEISHKEFLAKMDDNDVMDFFQYLSL